MLIYCEKSKHTFFSIAWLSGEIWQSSHSNEKDAAKLSVAWKIFMF